MPLCDVICNFVYAERIGARNKGNINTDFKKKEKKSNNMYFNNIKLRLGQVQDINIFCCSFLTVHFLIVVKLFLVLWYLSLLLI